MGIAGGRETPRLSAQPGASGGLDWAQAALGTPPPDPLPTSVLSPSVTVLFPAASQTSISLSPWFLMLHHSESLTPRVVSFSFCRSLCLSVTLRVSLKLCPFLSDGLCLCLSGSLFLSHTVLLCLSPVCISLSIAPFGLLSPCGSRSPSLCLSVSSSISVSICSCLCVSGGLFNLLLVGGWDFSPPRTHLRTASGHICRGSCRCLHRGC